MHLHHPPSYDRLQREFERSIRALLHDLCDELDAQRIAEVDTRLLRAVSATLPDMEFRSWKVTGLVEELNDLSYFLDVRARFAKSSTSQTVEEIFAECEEQFYENSYMEDVFPGGRPDGRGLGARVTTLCQRLARRVMQETVLVAPHAVFAHAAERGRAVRVALDLSDEFERAEPAGHLPIGTAGDWLKAPPAVSRALRATAGHCTAIFSTGGVLGLKVAARTFTVLRSEGAAWQTDWRMQEAPAVPGFPQFSLGPAIRFGKDKTPRKIVATPRDVGPRVASALGTIRQAWPVGFENLERFTTRIVPIQAPGVVSYSFRNRPRLSFINCFDRNQLDLVDDLIHENGHHHLNLLLRKYVLTKGDAHREFFYSPWRRSLRSLHGILHAAFTFTVGARLFERLSSSAGTSGVLPGLTRADVVRARFRCMEEVASVRYSLEDLHVAHRRLRWLTPHGAELVDLLEDDINDVEKRIRPWRTQVQRSAHGAALAAHIKVLQDAREHYRLK